MNKSDRVYGEDGEDYLTPSEVDASDDMASVSTGLSNLFMDDSYFPVSLVVLTC